MINCCQCGFCFFLFFRSVIISLFDLFEKHVHLIQIRTKKKSNDRLPFRMDSMRLLYPISCFHLFFIFCSSNTVWPTVTNIKWQRLELSYQINLAKLLIRIKLSDNVVGVEQNWTKMCNTHTRTAYVLFMRQREENKKKMLVWNT